MKEMKYLKGIKLGKKFKTGTIERKPHKLIKGKFIYSGVIYLGNHSYTRFKNTATNLEELREHLRDLLVSPAYGVDPRNL